MFHPCSQDLNNPNNNILEKSGMSEEKKEINEKPQIKKEHSYTYWVDEKTKSRELPEQHKPKKVDPPIHPPEAPSAGPSKWNALGTWEERAISLKELNECASQSINEWLNQKECQLILTQVSFQGEFKQIFSNNKKKILFELSGKIKFEGDDLHIKLSELTCSGDQEFQVKGKNKDEKQKLEAVAEKIVDVVLQSLNRYKQ